MKTHWFLERVEYQDDPCWAQINAQYDAQYDRASWYSFAKVTIRMEGEEKLDDEGLENLALILAAPEMLEVLVEAQNVIEENESLSHIREKITSVIGKARDIETLKEFCSE